MGIEALSLERLRKCWLASGDSFPDAEVALEFLHYWAQQRFWHACSMHMQLQEHTSVAAPVERAVI